MKRLFSISYFVMLIPSMHVKYNLTCDFLLFENLAY